MAKKYTVQDAGELFGGDNPGTAHTHWNAERTALRVGELACRKIDIPR